VIFRDCPLAQAHTAGRVNGASSALNSSLAAKTSCSNMLGLSIMALRR
jgi:hypothetical protein